MTTLAVVLYACRMLHIRDPAEFYAMPTHLQDLWTEYAVAEITSAWTPTRPTGPQSSQDALAAAAEIDRRMAARAADVR